MTGDMVGWPNLLDVAVLELWLAARKPCVYILRLYAPNLCFLDRCQNTVQTTGLCNSENRSYKHNEW